MHKENKLLKASVYSRLLECGFSFFFSGGEGVVLGITFSLLLAQRMMDFKLYTNIQKGNRWKTEIYIKTVAIIITNY